MKQEELSFLLTSNPAIQMLRQRSTRWMLPFLYHVYKEENRFFIPEDLLVQLLTETLSTQEDGTEDFEEARIVFGEDEETRSRKYILNWVQKRILQDFQNASGHVHYQLSAHTEKVFQWLLTLGVRNHVGTESRFKLLFNWCNDSVQASLHNIFLQ